MHDMHTYDIPHQAMSPRIAWPLLAAFVAVFAHAAENPFASQADALATPDFLPVDEAFVLEAALSPDGEVVAQWRMPDGYYLYRERFRFEAQGGAELGELVIPAGVEKTDEFFGDVEVYYAGVTVSAPVLATAGDHLEVGIEYQGCADYGLCYPPEKRSFTFAVASLGGTGAEGGEGGEAAAADGAAVGAAATANAGLLAALGGAFLGGLILNLMPCVFPVLSIKVLSLLGGGAGRGRHALGYAAGVLTAFIALGAALAIFKASGEAVGWGFQLQAPGFVAGMAILFFVLALNLLGFLEMPAFGVSGGQVGHFATGVLAVVAATPCTVPFMGVALGYGLSQSTWALLGVMAALGVGMALPYVLVTTIPPVARRLPRPGPWMVTLKQAMAFPMLLTVVWLLWVAARQSGPGAVAATLSACVATGFLAWLAWGRGARLPATWAGVAVVAALAIWAAPGLKAEAAPAGDSFVMDEVAANRAAGRPVFLNFTAAWCITCLANERSTLGTERIQDFFGERSIEQVKADWTNADPAITAALESFGRNGVPLYVYYPPGGAPVLLPQVLTPAIVIDTVESADARA